MAVTATTFTQRFPEFSNLESAVITATIAESQRQNDSDLWGDQYDDAVNYMTAHLLASRTQSIGQPDRRQSERSRPEVCRCCGVHPCRHDLRRYLSLFAGGASRANWL